MGKWDYLKRRMGGNNHIYFCGGDLWIVRGGVVSRKDV
jgi:hypothetical protein